MRWACLNVDASHSSTEHYAVECDFRIKLLICVLEMWKVACKGRNIARRGAVLRKKEGYVENQAIGCAEVFGSLLRSHEQCPPNKYLTCEITYEKVQPAASASLH